MPAPAAGCPAWLCRPARLSAGPGACLVVGLSPSQVLCIKQEPRNNEKEMPNENAHGNEKNITENEIPNQKSMEIKKHKSKLTMKCHTKACGCKTGNNIYKKSQQQKYIKVFAVSHFNTLCLGDSREPVRVVADVS